MKIQGTDFFLNMTRGVDKDTMHLRISGLCLSFTSWQDFSQENAPFLSLKNDGKPVANIQGLEAIVIMDALDNYGMR